MAAGGAVFKNPTNTRPTRWLRVGEPQAAENRRRRTRRFQKSGAARPDDSPSPAHSWVL